VQVAASYLVRAEATVRCTGLQRAAPRQEVPNLVDLSAARARTDEAPGSPTGEFVSGTAVSPYEFGTDAVQQYHSQYPKISLPHALVAHPGGGG